MAHVNNDKNTVLCSLWKSRKSDFSFLVLHKLYICQAKLHQNVSIFGVNSSRSFIGFSITLERTEREGRLFCLKVQQGKCKHTLPTIWPQQNRAGEVKAQYNRKEGEEGRKKMLLSVQLGHRKSRLKAICCGYQLLEGKNTIIMYFKCI